MSSLFKAALPFGLVLLASPAQAQLQEAALTDIFESYNDCFGVTETASLQPDQLNGTGWARATMKDDNGDAVADAPLIYGHSERKPIIMLSGLEGEGVCVVIARIKNLKVFEQFKKAFGGKLPKPDDKGSITYKAEGRIVQIAPTGSRKKPSVRLIVATRLESK